MSDDDELPLPKEKLNYVRQRTNKDVDQLVLSLGIDSPQAASPSYDDSKFNFVCTPPPGSSDSKFSTEKETKPIIRNSGELSHPFSEYAGPSSSVEMKSIRIPDMAPGLLTYRTVKGVKRPNIEQLLYGSTTAEDQEEELKKRKSLKNMSLDDSQRKFGMWDGVFARCLLNIFGVIMFLRLGYIMGIAGILQGTFIIVFSIVVTFTTTLSLSAICTNGEVQGGGAYFMISRSLGPAFGGSIGILFAIANAVSVAMYILGFAETLVDGILVPAGVLIFDGGIWDQVFWGMITLVVILIMCIIGVGWVIKIQLGLLVILVGCILVVIIGIFMATPDPLLGITGITANTTRLNMGPGYSSDPKAEKGGFFYAFSIFFPAVTGIMAGANISGEIKNPSYSIPWGTLLAVAISGVVYMILGILMGVCIEKTSLINNPLIMAKIALWEPAILAGIFAATLSSAIASFVGAPRILQAVAKDQLFPYLDVFSSEWRSEPVRGYFLTFMIGGGCILTGNLNAIAPLISGFFMISYTFVNLACFSASYAGLPGWRPSFKYYNKWVSFVTGCICFVVLFLLEPVFGVITFLLSVALYVYISTKAPDVNWGSAVDANKYKTAVRNISSLERVKYHVKNYKPQLLVLVGEMKEAESCERLELIVFSQQFRRSKGAYIYANVIVTPNLENIKDPVMREAHKKYLRSKARSPVKDIGIPIKNGFSETILAKNMRSGVRSILQMSGISKIRPNILMMGYKHCWMDESKEDVEEYVDIIRDAFFLNYGVCLVRDYREINKKMTEEGHVGTIDVWWLWDDGGLTALLPHLLHINKKWEKTELRVFVLCGEEQIKRMGEIVGLLRRLRIKSSPSALPLPVDKNGEVSEEIDPKFLNRYLDLKKKTHEREAKQTDGKVEISDKIPSRVKRHLKVAELIYEKSKDAELVVLTMPVPEVGLDAFEYMRWLECLSADLPPVCLLRGNQETVITFDL